MTLDTSTFDGEAAWKNYWQSYMAQIHDERKRNFLRTLNEHEWRIFDNLSMRYATWIHERNNAEGIDTEADTLWNEAERLAARAIVMYREYGITQGLQRRVTMERKYFQRQDIDETSSYTINWLDDYAHKPNEYDGTI